MYIRHKPYLTKVAAASSQFAALSCSDTAFLFWPWSSEHHLWCINPI